MTEVEADLLFEAIHNVTRKNGLSEWTPGLKKEIRLEFCRLAAKQGYQVQSEEPANG